MFSLTCMSAIILAREKTHATSCAEWAWVARNWLQTWVPKAHRDLLNNLTFMHDPWKRENKNERTSDQANNKPPSVQRKALLQKARQAYFIALRKSHYKGVTITAIVEVACRRRRGILPARHKSAWS